MNPRIFLPWLLVAIPLTCGVLVSVNTALPLFGARPAAIPYLTAPAASQPAPKPSAPVGPTVLPPLATPDAGVTPAR